MNHIGFGIMCFGEDKYFRGTDEKIENLTSRGYNCYVLTDNYGYFIEKYWGKINIVNYDRSFKSYHDKIRLVKEIHKKHPIAILIDADCYITDYDVFRKLETYEYEKGITYVDTLSNHKAKFKTVGEIPMDSKEWKAYEEYCLDKYKDFKDLETVWEYFIVFNRNNFNSDKFFREYEKLQIIKEYCDLSLDKYVSGAGEGISIALASKLSGNSINRDGRLSTLTNNIIRPVTRYTPSHLRPDFMKV